MSIRFREKLCEPTAARDTCLAGLCNFLVNEIHDVLSGCAGKKNLRDTRGFERGYVCFRDDAADEDGDVVHTFFVEKSHQLWADCVVCAG
jgi:hypothetical protein